MPAVQRRSWRILVLAAALVVAAAPQAAADSSTPVVPVTVSAQAVGQAMPSGFVGLSIEYSALRAYAGRDPRHVNPVFLALARGLVPGQPPVLRIGGNSTDATWWPLPRTAPAEGLTFALTRDWLRVAGAVAAGLRGRLILGVNLAADSPALASAEARALVAGIGRRYVEALEIGNEADVYSAFVYYTSRYGQNVFARPPGYGFADFLSEFARWRAALPAIPLAGPAFAEATWMAELPDLLRAEPTLSIVTFHRYPTRACEHNPAAADYASIPNLLSDNASSGLAHGVSPFVAVAHAAGRRFRLDELNSASCAGKRGVSDTFASALWVLDTLFDLASVGVDGVNIHTLPGSAYAPFTFARRGRRWSGSVRPLYYGLLAFGQAFPPGARLLSLSAPSGPVKAWATQGTDGHLRVVLINKDPLTAASVQLALPGAQTDLVEQALQAPALNAKSGVTFGGESFGASTTSGVLPVNPHLPVLAPANGYYTVALPAGSAVLLTR